MFYDVEDSIFAFDIKYSFLEYFFLETLPEENYAINQFQKFIQREDAKFGSNGVLFNRAYFKNFSGMPTKLMYEIARSWYYKNKLEKKDKFFNLQTIYEIEMHKRNDAQIILLSSFFFPCIEPFMEEFSLNNLICADLEIMNGYYTGNILINPIIEQGKEEAINKFLNNILLLKNQTNNQNTDKDNIYCDISYDYKEEIINLNNKNKNKNLYRN
jgi:hypothetical protein